jgi:hypothetical protein
MVTTLLPPFGVYHRVLDEGILRWKETSSSIKETSK